MAEERTGYTPLLVSGSVPGRPVAAVKQESPPLLGILQCWLQPSLDPLPGDSSRAAASVHWRHVDQSLTAGESSHIQGGPAMGQPEHQACNLAA